MIPNLHFEEIDTNLLFHCGPYSVSQFDSFMVHWYAPTDGVPDVFTSDSTKLADTCWNFMDTLLNYPGPLYTPGIEVPAFDTLFGATFVGIQTWSENNQNQRDYLQTALAAPADPDAYYKLGLSVSLAEHSTAATNSLGMLFSTTPILANGTGLLNFEPQLKNNDTITWDEGFRTVAWLYRPDSAYMYVTIGNFLPDSAAYVDTLQPDSAHLGFAGTYLYLDKPIYPGLAACDSGTVELTNRTLCEGDTIELEPGLNFNWVEKVKFYWSTGSHDWSIMVGDTGTYSLIVVADDSCVYETQCRVLPSWCDPEAKVANVFTPNGDGFNDRFMPYEEKDVARGILTIYNPYGQKVFETTNLDQGWDGRVAGGYKGQTGTYFWTLSLWSLTGISTHRSGSVTLIY